MEAAPIVGVKVFFRKCAASGACLLSVRDRTAVVCVSGCRSVYVNGVNLCLCILLIYARLCCVCLKEWKVAIIQSQTW